MATKTWAVILVVFCTLLTSTAQILYKTGAERLPLIFFNWPLIFGAMLYGIGALLLIIALRGGELTVLYPIIATSYVWVVILALLFLGEPIHYLRLVGIAMIIFGISWIAYGSRKMIVEVPL